MSEDEVTRLSLKWAEESAKRPGMEKSTFVTNHLFGARGLDDLIQFLREETDLHGQVFDSTCVISWAFITKPDPERAGWSLSRADLSQPHIVVRTQIEVVTDGRGEILGKQRYAYCGDYE